MQMPSVLVETGFISDKEEEEYLNSEKGQEEIAESIVNALANYIAAREKAPASNNGSKSPDAKNAKVGAAYIDRKSLAKQNPGK